jgi:putative toxin-antitoxin system antitoxin component (TIGR02293 family)
MAKHVGHLSESAIQESIREMTSKTIALALSAASAVSTASALAAHPGRVDESIFPKALSLLGGPRLLKHKPSSQAEVHAAAVGGIPYSVLFFLTDNIKGFAEEDVANVLGVSTRTLRRQKDSPGKAMPADLGSKTWLFAEILAKAEDVMGSKDDAERWMVEEAMGLDGARPIDLLRTLQGANLVSQFLERLKYGVYN